MDFVEGILDRRLIRIIGSLALVFFYEKQYADQGLPAVIGCSFVILLYLLLVWIRENWWDRLKYTLVSGIIISVTVILNYVYGIADSSLLWALVCLLATVYGKFGRLAVILASLTSGIIVLILYKDNHLIPFGTILALFGLFLGIRSRKIRREGYRMRQLHLQELNEAHHELQQAHAELQEATVHSMRYAALEERTRLAREIHDGLGHQLTSLIIQLQALEIMLPSDPEEASRVVAQLLDIARQAMAEVRLSARKWHSDEMGLGLIALKGLVEQTQIRSSLQINFVQDTELSEWPIEISIVLYRILQESLTNILRHSQASTVTVHLQESDEQVLLSVKDDGQYTEDQQLTPGFGLKGMLDRCSSHGGSCKLAAVKPHGLQLQAVLPIERRIFNGSAENPISAG
ncbi:MAG: Histidine kinase [Bacilli bacterium]|nr:Histidine kinase [Bacilli bacterium]